MLSLPRLLRFTAPFCAASLLHVACGGNVVVDGQGGAGAGSSSVTTNSVTATSTNVTTNTVTSTSSGPMGCDHHPKGCGDGGSEGCIGCAVDGPCAFAYDACVSSSNCIDFAGCIDPCQDQQCFDSCAMQFPQGAAMYNDLVICVVCDACPFDCDGFAECP